MYNWYDTSTTTAYGGGTWANVTYKPTPSLKVFKDTEGIALKKGDLLQFATQASGVGSWVKRKGHIFLVKKILENGCEVLSQSEDFKYNASKADLATYFKKIGERCADI